jgi:hypothetical protein
MRGVSGNRLAWGILGLVVLVAGAVGLTLAATARPAPAASSRTPAVATSARTGGGVAPGTVLVAGPAGPATSAVNRGSGSPAAPGPVWCCSAATPLGLTATGQASVPGASAAARTSAIAKATADAASQARAAAQAAGVALGRIINVDVSVPGYAYPLPMGAAARAGIPCRTPCASGVTGVATSSGPTSACPAGAMCAYPGASTYATVTITWAIG